MELVQVKAGSSPLLTVSPSPMEEVGRDGVYSSFAVCYPVEEEERRISGVKSSMRRGSAEPVNTHRDSRTRAVVRV